MSQTKSKASYCKTLRLNEEDKKLLDKLTAEGKEIIEVFRKGLEVLTKKK